MKNKELEKLLEEEEKLKKEMEVVALRNKVDNMKKSLNPTVAGKMLGRLTSGAQRIGKAVGNTAVRMGEGFANTDINQAVGFGSAKKEKKKW